MIWFENMLKYLQENWGKGDKDMCNRFDEEHAVLLKTIDPEIASSRSMLSFRIESFEFDTCVFGGKSPIDAVRRLIAIHLPRLDFCSKCL